MSFADPRRALRLFRRNTRGGVSTIMAFSAVPLILLVGASVDYTRAVTKKTSLQQASDATVLAVAHYLSQNMAPATLQTNTQNYFAAAVNDASAWIASGPTVSPDNTTVCITARNNVPTTIMRAAAGMGFAASNTMTVSAYSCAKLNNATFEIAMALDNSGSMNEATSGTTKIASLMSAAQQLVAIMDPAGQTPKTSFAIVPFSSAVKIDPNYATASFMDVNGQSSIHWQNLLLPTATTAYHPKSKFEFFKNVGKNWAGCVEERPAPYTTSDAPSTAANPDSLFVPYLWPDQSVSGGNNYLNEVGGLNGCTSGDIYDKLDKGSSTAYSNVPANTPRGDGQTKICKYNGSQAAFGLSLLGEQTGPNLLCDSQTVLTLTNDTNVVNSKVNSMYAMGDTNILSGFMWAWRTISPNGPFGGQPTTSIGNQNPLPYSGTVAANNNQKVIILMTDGMNHWLSTSDNNKSIYSSFGFYVNNRLGVTNASNYRTLMDTATLQACTNAKAAGVQIFTVGFSVPSDPIDAAGLALLQQCATKPSMYYPASDGSSLVAAFQDMGNQMSGLRLTN